MPVLKKLEFMFDIFEELDHFNSDLMDLVNDHATTEIESLESLMDSIHTSVLIEKDDVES